MKWALPVIGFVLVASALLIHYAEPPSNGGSAKGTLVAKKRAPALPALAARIERDTTGAATPMRRLEPMIHRAANAVETLESGDLRRALEQWLGIDEEWLKRLGIDERVFARRVLAIAARGSAEDPADNSDEILFSSSFDENNGPLLPTNRFTTGDVRIIAHVPADAFDTRERSALVRCFDHARHGIEMMQAVTLAPDAGSGLRSFSMRRPEGWDPGAREVELYRIAENAPLVARGTFEIGSEADHWMEATSSLELLPIDIDSDGAAPLDFIGSPRESFRIAFRGMDDGGALPTLRLQRIDGQSDESLLALRRPDEALEWWSATVPGVPGGSGLFLARLEKDGAVLEQTTFRVLDRDAGPKKGEIR